jgi:hypothetical protein
MKSKELKNHCPPPVLTLGCRWAMRCASQTPWPVGDATAAPAAATHYWREVGEAYWRGWKTEPSIWDPICGGGGTGAQELGLWAAAVSWDPRSGMWKDRRRKPKHQQKNRVVGGAPRVRGRRAARVWIIIPYPGYKI